MDETAEEEIEEKTPNQALLMQALLKEHFSARAFFQAFIIGTLLYVILGTVVYMNAETTISQIEKSLSSRNVIIRNLNYDTSLGLNKNRPLNPVKETFSESGQVENVKSTEAAPAMKDIENFKSQSDALYPAPIKGLFETSDTGPLPIISANDITPFDAYKKPYSITDKPTIVVAIKNFGLNASLSDEILNTFPKNVTLLVSPYANTTREWLAKARKAGFETWLMVPGQNDKILKSDIGSQALIADMSYLDNRDVANNLLSRASGYAGVAMYTDNILNLSNPFSNVVLKDFFGRGLGFFEINQDAPLTIESLATQSSQPYVKNENMLNEMSLRNFETKAREDRYSIGILQPYPNALKSLRNWLATLETKKIEIAPLSAVQKIKEDIENKNKKKMSEDIKSENSEKLEQPIVGNE